VGDLVVYLASIDKETLQLVAVDPATASIEWTVPAGLSYQPSGVPLWLGGNDTDTWIFDPEPSSVDKGELWLESVDAHGAERWRRHVVYPVEQATSCGERICIQTNDYLLSIDADDGRNALKGRAVGDRRVVASEDELTVAVGLGKGILVPAVDVALLGGAQREVTWVRPLAEVFGRADLTPDRSWEGGRHGSTWVVHLGAVGVGDKVPDFPYRDPAGGAAAFGDDGRTLWQRPHADLCPDLSTTTVVVFCDGQRVYPSKEEKGTWMVTSFEQVEPSTGRTLLRVELTEPLDMFESADRLVRAGPDRWLLVDGQQVRVVDFAKSTVEPADPGERSGWCPENDYFHRIDWDGKDTQYAKWPTVHPCTLAGADVSDDQRVAAVADGTLEPPNHRSVARVGSWILWIEGGRLTGVLGRS
jgi:hypothetical protein